MIVLEWMIFACKWKKNRGRNFKIKFLGAEDSSKLSKILSLAEPPGVSRYGERRRHKSGQSDSSINTASTSRTNYSEPITTTNGEKIIPII